jgi:SAM-dependent methyltransferase
MSSNNDQGDAQRQLWNGAAGRAWVASRQTLDRMFLPLERLLVNAVAGRSGRRVLDVGCGTGSTTLAVARHLGERGLCTGIDLSEPMITAARLRAEQERTSAEFICANAQTYPFERGAFDTVISRFGVMFFDDPVTAFANLHHATEENGALCCVAWRSATENPFMTTAERAAAPLLPDLPPRQPDAPGQFAFANRDRVRAILEQSGWNDIVMEPRDVQCTLPQSDLDGYVTQLGPVGVALETADDLTRAKVLSAVRPAFAPYLHGSEVRFTAACWMVIARRGALSAE